MKNTTVAAGLALVLAACYGPRIDLSDEDSGTGGPSGEEPVDGGTGTQGQSTDDGGETGSVLGTLQIGAYDITTAQWSITLDAAHGGSSESGEVSIDGAASTNAWTGTIDVGGSSALEFAVGRLPVSRVANDYTILLTAFTVDGTYACASSANFTIVAAQVSTVTLGPLVCQPYNPDASTDGEAWTSTGTSTSVGDTGSLKCAFSIFAYSIDTVNWTMTSKDTFVDDQVDGSGGPSIGGSNWTGTVNVSDTGYSEFTVGRLPASPVPNDYSVTVTANTRDGAYACSAGPVDFSITAETVTTVNLGNLYCQFTYLDASTSIEERTDN
jgi:hypothetical protein